MKRLLIMGLMIFSFTTTETVFAKGEENQTFNERSPFEEPYFKVGYKSVEEALKECEKHFHRELKLPFKLPPVTFTHHFGRFNNAEGEINDNFEIEFLNENTGRYHYSLRVNPSEYKTNFSNKREVIRTYTLKDGTKAIYLTTPQYGTTWNNLLVFEKYGWQYILSIDNRIEEKVSANVLVDIAESVK